MPETTMAICSNKEQIGLIEKYAKSKGMVKLSRVVEHIIKNSKQ